MRLWATRFPAISSGVTVVFGSVAFLVLGFVLDLATAQELVVAIVYNVPIALSGLSPVKRLLRYTTAAALALNFGAGILNALGGVDTVSLLNRMIAALSYLLVAFMTASLRRSAARVAALQASEAQAEREHALHALAEALAGALTPEALLERTASVLRQQLRAETVVISGFEGNRFSAPQFSDPPQAAANQARSGSQLPWLAALARRQEPPVAAGFDDDARQLLIGLLEQPQTWAVLVVGAQTPGAPLYLGDALRDLGKLLERAELLANLERQRSELARRNGVIRDLVYAFSHDLRTPLIANAMNMRLALEGAYGPLEDDYMRVLQNGLSANEDLLELADSLLLVARLESGEMSPPEATDLRILLEQTLARMEPVAHAREVTLKLDAPAELKLLGRAADLRRVAQNLLDNAIRFSPEGGVVIVALRRDDTDLSAQGAQLSVCDDGPGVAEAVLPHLFERFSHGRAGGGSGLGLYLAKQIVVGHGGDLHYTPQPGGGSCFRVWLPLAREAVTA